MYARETNHELVLKLLMVETGEVLSVTRASIAKALRLGN